MSGKSYKSNYDKIGCRNTFGSLTANRCENWKPIMGGEFDEIALPYWVSDGGKVFSSVTGKILRPLKVNGYAAVNLMTKSGKYRSCYIHNLVYEFFGKRVESTEDLVVNHIDHRPNNNEISNLERLTRADNTRDGIAHSCFGNGKVDNIEADRISMTDGMAIVIDDCIDSTVRGRLYSKIGEEYRLEYDSGTGLLLLCDPDEKKNQSLIGWRKQIIHALNAYVNQFVSDAIDEPGRAMQ